MKNFLLLFTALLNTTICSIAATPGETKASENLANKPLLFMENKGQVADMEGKLRPDILFTSYSKGTKLFFSADGIYYQFMKSEMLGRTPEEREKQREKA